MSLTKKIWVLMGLNDKEFQTKMDAVTTKLRKVQKDSVRDARRLSITTQELFYGMTLPMGLFAKTVFDATRRIESLHIGLATIAKSKGISDIEGLIKSTTALAKLPGLGLEETFRGVKDLISVGFGASQALDTVKGLGIGIARAGGNAETFGRIMTQVTQALSKSKLEMQDFKTIFEQMPEARGILEKTFGPGMSDLENLRKKGIGVKDVLGALVDGFKELGAAGHMDTLANKIENLSDNWLIFRATIGEKILKDQIHSVLDGLSNGLESATKAINNMSPEMRNLVAETAKWLGITAVALPTITYLGKMFYLLKAQAAALGAAFLRMNPYVAAFAGALIGIEQIGKRVWDNWTGLTNELKIMGKWLYYTLKPLDDFFAKMLGFNNFDLGPFTKIPKGARRDFSLFSKDKAAKDEAKAAEEYAKAQERAAKAEAERAERVKKLNEELEDLAKAHKDVLAVGIEAYNEMPESLNRFIDNQLKWFRDTIDNVSEIFMARGDIFAGFRAADPLGNISTQDQAAALFANDDNVKSLDLVTEKLTKYRDIMAEVFTGPIADGVQGVADSFGSFMDAVLTGSEDAFGTMAKALGNAVKDMIVSLVALIAKLAIAAALVAIIFPGAGGLKAFLGGTGGFAEGGAFFGKGGFLKGILGFADGGVVGGSSKYGDKILARVNSGELMLNERQQKSVYSQMTGGGSVRINGELMVRGRNLVYVLEETQVQLKSAR